MKLLLPWLAALMTVVPVGVAAPDAVKRTCAELAAAAGELDGLTVRQSSGTVHDDRTDSDHEGCRIVVSGAGVTFPDGGWPQDLLRARLASGKWREDLRRAADGPDGTAFAMRKGSVLCLFSAAWDPDGEAEPQGYRLDVGCFATDEPANQESP